MLKFQIQKFYKIFGEVVDRQPFTVKFSDIKSDDFLFDVLFDINEVLEANSNCFCEEAYEMDAWLNKLKIQIINRREKPQRSHKTAVAITLVALALISGYIIGRQHTIRNAELYGITDDGYYINFGNDIHEYTFGEVR